MTTGRNDPCPCGSGKKYKKCCLNTAPDAINYTKQKLHRFHDRIVGELIRHGAKTFGQEAFDEAAAEFFGWPEGDEAEEMNLERHEAVFYPWFLFKWRIDADDDDIGLAGPREMSIVQSYLQAHGRRLDAVERQYLEGLASSPFSFFEITAVEPGKSVALRDLLLDRGYRVLERSASRSLHEGDVVFGSVIEAGGIGLFGALSMIAFKPSAKLSIISMRDWLSRSGKVAITPEMLDEYDLELRDLYHDLFAARAAMPALRNTDGEKLSFHTLKYAISSPQRVFDALKGLTNGFATEKEMLDEAEFDLQGHLHKVKIPWLVAANPRHSGMGNTVHGRLVINGTLMTCEVNSAERARRLRAIIEKRLPAGEAVYQTTVIQSADAMLRDAPPSTDASVTHEELMDRPEVRAHIDEMMRNHWSKWPDIELPALHGKTPRQAVRDELGRQLVNALLEDAERSCRAANGAMGSLDNLRMVRRVLGFEPS
jgi:hypothetical protein